MNPALKLIERWSERWNYWTTQMILGFFLKKPFVALAFEDLRYGWLALPGKRIPSVPSTLKWSSVLSLSNGRWHSCRCHGWSIGSHRFRRHRGSWPVDPTTTSLDRSEHQSPLSCWRCSELPKINHKWIMGEKAPNPLVLIAVPFCVYRFSINISPRFPHISNHAWVKGISLSPPDNADIIW